MSGVARQIAWHLPWHGEQVPHALLDITRKCAITCRSCYNIGDGGDKPLATVQEEIRELAALRKLASISIVGGEPTLHPDLMAIIAFIRGRGLHAELFTNGVALDDAVAAELARAGLDVAFLHIQAGQGRPDLPEGAADTDRERLLAEKAELLTHHGIEAGLSITAYPDSLHEVERAVNLCLASPGLNYLLITLDRDVRNMPEVTGDIRDGLVCADGGRGAATGETIRMAEMMEIMARNWGWSPFCYLGSNVDRFDPRWLSFVAVCAYDRAGVARQHPLASTLLERLYLRLELALTGRYPFYSRQRQGMLKLHLLLNGLAGGGFLSNLAFLLRAFRSRQGINLKKVLFQSPAHVAADGRVVHCANCPDAVLKNGRLVPACISDRVRS